MDVFKRQDNLFNPLGHSGWADRINAKIKALGGSPPDEDNPYFYLGSCVVLDGDKITVMTDGAQEITLKTLRKHCDTAPFEVALGYGNPGEDVLRLSKDPHVAYYKSKYDGHHCYYIVHSAIEYVWVDARTWEPGRFIIDVEASDV